MAFRKKQHVCSSFSTLQFKGSVPAVFSYLPILLLTALLHRSLRRQLLDSRLRFCAANYWQDCVPVWTLSDVGLRRCVMGHTGWKAVGCNHWFSPLIAALLQPQAIWAFHNPSATFCHGCKVSVLCVFACTDDTFSKTRRSFLGVLREGVEFLTCDLANGLISCIPKGSVSTKSLLRTPPPPHTHTQNLQHRWDVLLNCSLVLKLERASKWMAPLCRTIGSWVPDSSLSCQVRCEGDSSLPPTTSLPKRNSPLLMHFYI